jgi:AAA15 family ATPase/GTPase
MGVFIHKLHVKNFKSLKDVSLIFNKDLNILTGVNKSGKTTVLEALSLWHECFTLLISEAKRGERNYKRGDHVLGPSSNRYFPFSEINSVRCPNYEDIFHQRNKRNPILLSLTLSDEFNETLSVPFKISSSGSNYVIALDGYGSYDHRKFNDYFAHLPSPVSLIYSTPLTKIDTDEDFFTPPIIKERLLFRKSDSVLRNRLYQIINDTGSIRNNQFLSDLNYVLFNSLKSIEFQSQTNINKDSKAIISFRIGKNDVFKDLSLLGSGTLQIIGILLNLHLIDNGKFDLNVILLDEPDSHIHRDIQKRMLEVFNKYGNGIQTFLTTHNESLIRSASPAQIFHLDGKSVGEFRSIHFDYEKQNLGLHFKGVMPNNLTPVLRSIGNTTGLDLINALECDKLIFVEGEDDARIYKILLSQQINLHKKYMFWVLGGISEVFENAKAYKEVFSNLKNGVSLWEKSVLIFDKDELSDEHKDLFLINFKEKLGISAYSANSYTLESTLLLDLQRTSNLLSKLVEKATGKIISSEEIQNDLEENFLSYEVTLLAKFNQEYYKNAYFRLKNSKIAKANEIFGAQVIRINEFDLAQYTQNYFEQTIQKKEFYKIMDKHDVESVIKLTIEKYGLIFSIESDFIEIIKLVDKSTWISEWDFLNNI